MTFTAFKLSRETVVFLMLVVSMAIGAAPASNQPMVAEAIDWSARLAQLNPARPIAYFELGEEVADAATTPQERELARTLFGLAGALDPSGFGRSSALAQASLVSDDRQRRMLRALASLLDPHGEAAVAEAAGRQRPSVTTAIAVSEAFSHLRRGQGPRALGLVKAPDAEAMLQTYGSRLPGGAERFREDCRTFKGGLRPSLTPEQLQVMFMIEEAMLAAAGGDRDRNWSSSLVETEGRPLLEIDTARIEDAFGVDPTRPYWSGGQWSQSR